MIKIGSLCSPIDDDRNRCFSEILVSKVELVGIPLAGIPSSRGKSTFLRMFDTFFQVFSILLRQSIYEEGITGQRSSRIFPTSDFEWTIGHGGNGNWIRLVGTTIWTKEEKREEKKKCRFRFRVYVLFVRKIISTLIYG